MTTPEEQAQIHKELRYIIRTNNLTTFSVKQEEKFNKIIDHLSDLLLSGGFSDMSLTKKEKEVIQTLGEELLVHRNELLGEALQEHFEQKKRETMDVWDGKDNDK